MIVLVKCVKKNLSFEFVYQNVQKMWSEGNLSCFIELKPKVMVFKNFEEFEGTSVLLYSSCKFSYKVRMIHMGMYL